jgi:DNA repair protein RecO (recombination protein O)
MASTYSARAIVLRTRLLGEKDRVLTLLSPEWGKFAAVAKGARNPKSKQAATSQPFVRARFLIAPGRTLHIATQSQIEDAHIQITGDLVRTAWASYVCELCDAMPENQPDEALFEILEKTLAALDEPDASAARLELAAAWFQTRYLHILGYAPTIGHCVASGAKIVVAPDDMISKIAFSPSLGGTLCSTEATRDADRLMVSAGALRALHTLSRAATPPPELELSSAAQRELREVLRRQLVLHLDTRLKSQKFLDEILAVQ